jgi:uncharacterized protein YkwD
MDQSGGSSAVSSTVVPISAEWRDLESACMFRLGTWPIPPSAVGGLLAFTLFVALSWQPVAAADAAIQLPGDPALITLISVEQALLNLTNIDRAANGLDPLEFDPETLGIARERAASQLGTAALSHNDPDGQLAFVRLLAAAQLGYQLAGENLARSSVDDAAVPQRVEEALMTSPAHRKNILEKSFTKVAIGAATDTQGQLTFAEVYRN